MFLPHAVQVNGYPMECWCTSTFNPNYTSICPSNYQCPANNSFYCGNVDFWDAFGAVYNRSWMVFRLQNGEAVSKNDLSHKNATKSAILTITMLSRNIERE